MVIERTTMMLATIGYERSTLDDFVATLVHSGVEVLVDIRDRAQSRRPGFSKTALSYALGQSGISYIHFRELGDPKEGREAARQGRLDLFREIFREVMSTNDAKLALAEIGRLAAENKVCLMCYERDHNQCHRKIVADHLSRTLSCKTLHLGVRSGIVNERPIGRMLHIDQSSAASV
jgi:uncharacterized protein (DUF488 family)